MLSHSECRMKGKMPPALLRVLLVGMSVLFHTSFVCANTVGAWAGDMPTLNWLGLDTQQDDLSFSLSWNSLGVTWIAGDLTLDADLRAPASEQPILWNEPLNWGNALIHYAYFQNMKRVLLNGDEISLGSSSDIALAEYEGLDGVINSGPTEKDVTIQVAKVQLPVIPDLSFNIGTHVRFTVDIDGDRYVRLNQDSILEVLYIDAGSTLEIEENRSLFLNQPSSNSGNMINAGRLNTPAGFTSTGSFIMESGRLSGDFTNLGDFEWSGGDIKGNVTNNSATFTVVGDSWKGQGGDLRNLGTITHSATGTMSVRGQLNNLSSPKTSVQWLGG